jgi:hypothetical protein
MNYRTILSLCDACLTARTDTDRIEVRHDIAAPSYLCDSCQALDTVTELEGRPHYAVTVPFVVDANSPVGAILDGHGFIYDVFYTWECGQTMAAQYRCVALRGDSIYSQADLQRMFDYERSIYVDCFGS